MLSAGCRRGPRRWRKCCHWKGNPLVTSRRMGISQKTTPTRKFGSDNKKNNKSNWGGCTIQMWDTLDSLYHNPTSCFLKSVLLGGVLYTRPCSGSFYCTSRFEWISSYDSFRKEKNEYLEQQSGFKESVGEAAMPQAWPKKQGEKPIYNHINVTFHFVWTVPRLRYTLENPFHLVHPKKAK